MLWYLHVAMVSTCCYGIYVLLWYLRVAMVYYVHYRPMYVDSTDYGIAGDQNVSVTLRKHIEPLLKVRYITLCVCVCACVCVCVCQCGSCTYYSCCMHIDCGTSNSPYPTMQNEAVRLYSLHNFLSQ